MFRVLMLDTGEVVTATETTEQDWFLCVTDSGESFEAHRSDFAVITRGGC